MIYHSRKIFEGTFFDNLRPENNYGHNSFWEEYDLGLIGISFFIVNFYYNYCIEVFIL